MIEKGIEYDADALSAVDDCKGIEGDDEEEGGGTMEASGKYGKNGEEQRCEDLKRNFS